MLFIWNWCIIWNTITCMYIYSYGFLCILYFPLVCNFSLLFLFKYFLFYKYAFVVEVYLNVTDLFSCLIPQSDQEHENTSTMHLFKYIHDNKNQIFFHRDNFIPSRLKLSKSLHRMRQPTIAVRYLIWFFC